MTEPFLRRTPFHARIAPLAHAEAWERWQGYLTPTRYDSAAAEYFAIRNGAGLYDVSPLIKYRITGADAARFVDRLITRDIGKCAVGQAFYVAWCDDDGRLIEDGTLFRLGADDFLLNAALHNLHWLRDTAYGFAVAIDEVSEEIAGLALQGPQARIILDRLGVPNSHRLGYMRVAEIELDGRALRVSRSGFTGDLGYELWVAAGDADWLWDRVTEAGAELGLLPVGTAALNLARLEAGFILVNVDYMSAAHALRPSQKRFPDEVGLGWAVDLGKAGYFVGKRALAAARESGAARHALVGLDIAGRKPAVESFVYAGGTEIGRTTSAAWSPTLKKNIALATVARAQAAPGTALAVEIWQRKELKIEKSMVPARVVPRPFYDPPRKRE